MMISTKIKADFVNYKAVQVEVVVLTNSKIFKDISSYNNIILRIQNTNTNNLNLIRMI